MGYLNIHSKAENIYTLCTGNNDIPYQMSLIGYFDLVLNIGNFKITGGLWAIIVGHG